VHGICIYSTFNIQSGTRKVIPLSNYRKIIQIKLDIFVKLKQQSSIIKLAFGIKYYVRDLRCGINNFPDTQTSLSKLCYPFLNNLRFRSIFVSSGFWSRFNHVRRFFTYRIFKNSKW